MADPTLDDRSGPQPAPESTCATAATAPCGSCPWRVGATADRIPGFDPVRATTSLRSVAGEDGDGFRAIMACHLSTDGNDLPCVGYVASDDGWANLGVRVAAITGRLDLAAIQDACDTLELHSTFDEMLDALMDTVEQ